MSTSLNCVAETVKHPLMCISFSYYDMKPLNSRWVRGPQEQRLQLPTLLAAGFDVQLVRHTLK